MMVMSGLKYTATISGTLADWLGLGKPKATGLAGDVAKLVIIDDIDELTEKDHFITTVLACPADKCQAIRACLEELNGNPLYSESGQ